MKVILFGATGMIGQGVLRECLLDSRVESVLIVTRTTTGEKHPKVRELLHDDFSDLSAIRAELRGYDACFFCLGVSSAGMSEADYHRITYDYTMAAARVLAEESPGMTFLYISGAGTDSSERGRTMWARVKGKTENALLKLPFKASYMLRPGFIQPLHGIVSKTRLYRAIYAIVGPLYPLWKRLFGKYVTNTEELGRAMVDIGLNGAPQRVLENDELAAIGAAAARGAA